MATVQSDQLLEDAALVVDECFSVEEGDVVTIICDDDREDEARAVAEVCVERGAWPVIMNNETQVRRGRADVRFPMAPPENLHRAMVGSDEVIIIAEPGVGEPLRARERRPRDVRGEREDRVDRAGHG